jgi:hypothetical protein
MARAEEEFTSQVRWQLGTSLVEGLAGEKQTDEFRSLTEKFYSELR